MSAAVQSSLFDLLDLPAPEPQPKPKAGQRSGKRPAAKVTKRKPARTINVRGADPADLIAAHMEIAREPHRWREALSKVKLPPNSYRVGLHLIDKRLNRKTGRCFPTQEAIADNIGLDERAVRHAVSALRKAGLIVTRKLAYTGPNDIFFAIPAALRTDTAVSVQDDTEPSQPCRTNRHPHDGGTDTAVTVNNHRNNLRKRTIEEHGAGSRTPAGGPPANAFAIAPASLASSSEIAGVRFSPYEKEDSRD